MADWTTDAATLTELFDSAVAHAPDRPYLRGTAIAASYAEADAAVSALAAGLGALGGATVLLTLPNGAAFLVAFQAVLRAGGVPALVNPSLPEAARAALRARIGAPLTISDAEADIVLDDAALRALLSAAPSDAPRATPRPEDRAVLLFSGGTTGVPKTVPHSHRALVAAVERMEWGWPTGPDETWLPVAPFTHVYGFLMGVLNPLLRAGTVVLPDRFRPDHVVDLLARERVTVFGGGPPAVYQALLSAMGPGSPDLAHLRVCPGGGAPFPVAVHDRWRAATGCPIHEGYGMTEIAPIAVNGQGAAPRPGTVGTAVPDVTLSVVDVETGTREMPAGTPGEIRVRGPHLMAGYLNAPEETAQALRDGWLMTGDVGTLDGDGVLTLTDRKKDVILHKGFNVFPREVEEVLMAHPGIGGACVVGRPDARAGEVAIAFVSGDAAPDDVIAHCARFLAAYKLPADVQVLDTLPLTAAGKLDRIALRERARH